MDDLRQRNADRAQEEQEPRRDSMDGPGQDLPEVHIIGHGTEGEFGLDEELNDNVNDNANGNILLQATSPMPTTETVPDVEEEL